MMERLWAQLSDARGAYDRHFTIFPSLIEWAGNPSQFFFYNYGSPVSLQMMMWKLYATTSPGPILRSNQSSMGTGQSACSMPWTREDLKACWGRRCGSWSSSSSEDSKSALPRTGLCCTVCQTVQNNSRTLITHAGKSSKLLLGKDREPSPSSVTMLILVCNCMTSCCHRYRKHD